MVLPCIEVKRFEESMFSCPWPLQQTAAMLKGGHIFLAQKLEAKIASLVFVHCHAHRLASASCYTAADLYSKVCETAKGLSCNNGMFYCFTVAIDLHGDASCIRLHEDKRSIVATGMQNKVVAE